MADVTPAEATRLGDALGAAAETFRIACEKVKCAQKAYDDAISEHRRITGSNIIRADQFFALQLQLDDAWRRRIDAYMAYTDARLDMLIRSSNALGPAIAELRAQTARIRRGDFGDP